MPHPGDEAGNTENMAPWLLATIQRRRIAIGLQSEHSAVTVLVAAANHSILGETGNRCSPPWIVAYPMTSECWIAVSANPLPTDSRRGR